MDLDDTAAMEDMEAMDLDDSSTLTPNLSPNDGQAGGCSRLLRHAANHLRGAGGSSGRARETPTRGASTPERGGKTDTEGMDEAHVVVYFVY